MKIVHVCIQSIYNDYWGYQDNLLPKYHQSQGHDVTVITTNKMFKKNKGIVEIEEKKYYLIDGQRIIRKKRKNNRNKNFEAFSQYKIYDELCKISPNFIMVHGLTDFSVLQVAKYSKKNRKCNIVADTHLDYYNAPLFNKTLKAKLYRICLRVLNKYMQRYYSKVYGVTPWRMEFANKVLGIDNSKLDLLVMGGDTEKIKFDKQQEIRAKLRKKYNIDSDDFVIITGGKIDKSKNIHLVLKAVSKMECKNLKIMFFGNADNEMKQEIEILSKNKKIINIGWLDADSVYDYFLTSDLAIFPGTHSVLWEQACSCGIPLVVKWWEGMQHVNVGGNCRFLYNDSEEEIIKVITEILNEDTYEHMKGIAWDKGREKFSYDKIAKKALETVKNERKI